MSSSNAACAVLCTLMLESACRNPRVAKHTGVHCSSTRAHALHADRGAHLLHVSTRKWQEHTRQEPALGITLTGMSPRPR
eukprot:1366284-Alexandrium_andersonii.AAC.1